MKRWLAACASSALLLTGCGGPAEAYVVSKRIVPPMSWVWLMPMTTCVGSICSTTLIPIQEHEDECPELTLKPDPGKTDTTTTCVDQSTYDRTAIGDFYKEQK